MDIANKRDYKNRLLEDVNKYGIEYLFKIIDMDTLQKHYICRDWHENPFYSGSRVARLHAYNKTNNFTKICGCKKDAKK